MALAAVKTTKAKESKADKFKRLGSIRVGNVLKQMDNLTKLANRNGYDWTKDQADKIINAIDARAVALKKALQAEKTEKAPASKFDL